MRSNFICIFFIGIVFDAVWLQRLCFFLSDFFDFGRLQKIFSFFTKKIIKTNLLFYLVLVLQFRFSGFAFCRVYSARLLRFAFLPYLFSFGSLVSLFAAFSCSRFPCFVSQTLFILLFSCLFLQLCFFSRAFPALFFRAQKVLKNVLKIFMVWRSLYRGHILTIFILILSNLIQKIKTQFVFFLDFCCFWFYF